MKNMLREKRKWLSIFLAIVVLFGTISDIKIVQAEGSVSNVTVTLQDEAGETPEAFAHKKVIIVKESDSDERYEAETDENGKASFTNSFVEDEKYIVTVSDIEHYKDASESYTASLGNTSIEIVMKEADSCRVEGTVIREGKGYKGAVVTFKRDGYKGVSVTTDQDGKYTVDGKDESIDQGREYTVHVETVAGDKTVSAPQDNKKTFTEASTEYNIELVPNYQVEGPKNAVDHTKFTLEGTTDGYVPKGEEYTAVIGIEDDDYFLQTFTVNGESKLSDVTVKGKEYRYKGIADKEPMQIDYEVVKAEETTDMDIQFSKTGLVDSEGKNTYVYDKNTTSIVLTVPSAEQVAYLTSEGKREISTGESITINGETDIKKVYAYMETAGGHDKKWVVLEEQYIISIDKTGPVAAVEKDTYYTKEKEIELSLTAAPDKGEKYPSKIASVVYYNVKNPAEKKECDKKGDVYTFKAVPAPDSADDQEVVYEAYAVDQAGNSGAPVSVTVIFDRTKPQVNSVVIDNKEDYQIDDKEERIISQGNQLMLTVGAEDRKNGTARPSDVEKIIMRVRDKNNKNIIMEQEEKEPDASGKCQFTLQKRDEAQIVELTCVDRAGNESEIADLTEFGLKNCFYISDAEVKNTYQVTYTGEGTVYDMSDGKTVKYAVPDTKGYQLHIQSKDQNANTEFPVSRVEVYSEKMNKPNATSGNSLDIDLSELELEPGKENKITVISYCANKRQEDTIYIAYDVESPVVDKFVVLEPNQDKEIDYGRFFSYLGTFLNHQVRVQVHVSDSFTGVKRVALLIEKGPDGYSSVNIPLDSSMIDSEGYATFLIPENTLAPNGRYVAGNLKFYAYDNVGNCSAYTELDSINSNIRSTKWMMETVAPTIAITAPKETYNADNKKWYDKDTTFHVQVGDKDSGLYQVVITLNDHVVIDKIRGSKNGYKETGDITTEDSFDISTEQVEKNSDGSYVLSVKVTDNAGNRYESQKQIVYVDEGNPYITSFEFDAEKYKESKKTDFGVEKRDYGYYFRKKTDVVIHAKDDAPSSGVKTISYYMVDKDGKKSVVKEAVVNKNGEISFSIAANFKGQIYAMPKDYVGHQAGQYVTPDSVVVESALKHKEETHIAFSKPTSKLRDKEGVELFNKDVAVAVTVSDHYSGIREIEYSVESPYDTKNNQKGTVIIDNDGEKKKGSSAGWEKTKKEANLVTEMKTTLKVKNNSNGIVLRVKLTDRSGNVSEESIVFSIDKIAPQIQVSYDNNNSDSTHKEFYKKNRIATIVVTERNFNAADFKSVIKNKDGSAPEIDLTKEKNWKKHADQKDPDKTTYTAKVAFGFDGKFEWDMAFSDMAKNSAAKVKKQKFTIDMSVPSVTVTYDNMKSENGNYYKNNRTATITIDEHNFDESRVKITGTAKENGKPVSFPEIGGWSTDKDTHVATVLFSNNALYTFSVEFTDKAGNKAVKYAKDTFTVDKQKPTVKMSKIKNKGAYKGAVTPVIDFYDVNFDVNNTEIILSGSNHDKRSLKGGSASGSDGIQGTWSEIPNGRRFTFTNFKKDKKTDDIYTLEAKIEDKAGNQSKIKKMFSVNRFGSVYTCDSVLLQAMKRKYVNSEFDVVITETNTDEVNGIRVKLTKNGTPKDLVLKKDYDIVRLGGNGEWVQYVYKIKKELFAGDGNYIIDLYSEDRAGNVNENGEDSKKATVMFGIDKTAPVITPIDLKNDTQYAVEQKTVEIDIKDNLVLGQVKMYLNDTEIPYDIDENGRYHISVGSAGYKQKLSIHVEDMANNKTALDVTGFLVSTNIFVRWVNNLPLFIGTLVGLGILLLLAAGLVIYKIRKRKMIVKED